MPIDKDLANLRAVSIPTQWQLRKVKKIWVTEFNECAICANPKHLETHHCDPMHNCPARALDRTNFITLCDAGNNACHKWWGHYGDFIRLFNEQIKHTAVLARFTLESQNPDRVFKVSTDKLIESFAQSLRLTVGEFLDEVYDLQAPLLTRMADWDIAHPAP